MIHVSDLVKSEKRDLLRLFHSKDEALSIPEPFEQRIFLCDTYVAGTTKIDRISETDKRLSMGDRLRLLREPDHMDDPQAILILTESGDKLGYVPRQDNVILARLMDAGNNSTLK